MPIPQERQEEILRRLNYVQGQINGVKPSIQNGKYSIC
jgi:DNA-binding FrmR family transcriptional regulator